MQGWVVPFEEQAIDTWRRAIEVNLTAAFHLSQVLTPLLRASGHGSIINIGSIYGVVGPDLRLYEGTPMGNPAAYAASKGGLLQATKWLASVLGPDVRVNAISPGGIARNQPEVFARRYEQKTPLRRMGAEEEFQGSGRVFRKRSICLGHGRKLDGGWRMDSLVSEARRRDRCFIIAEAGVNHNGDERLALELVETVAPLRRGRSKIPDLFC